MGELEKSCLVASRNHTKCLFPPYLNLPLVDRPGLPGTLMQSGRCHGKFPYHWRSVQQLLPSPWSERRLLLDHSSNAARCDLSRSQGSSQVPARASPLTARRLHMRWRWKEGRDGVRDRSTGATALHLTAGKCFRNLTWKANSIWWKEDYFMYMYVLSWQELGRLLHSLQREKTGAQHFRTKYHNTNIPFLRK